MIQIQLPIPKERNLFLSSQVTQDSMLKLSKEILEINDHDQYLSKIYSVHNVEYNPDPIKIFIDSYGGQVYQCFGLLGIMNKSKVPIHTIVTGCAMSCGFLISISGHKRFGYDSATYLYHQVSNGTIGKAKDLEENVIEVKRLQKMIEKLTIKQTKITSSKLKEVYNTKFDWYMNSNEALKLGVIDEIL